MRPGGQVAAAGRRISKRETPSGIKVRLQGARDHPFRVTVKELFIWVNETWIRVNQSL